MGAVSAASAAEQNVLAMASWNPAASRVRRTVDSASAQGSALHAFAECGQRVGEAVVAVDAGDFFDEVDFAFEVETPAGKRAHLPFGACADGVKPQPSPVSTDSTVAAVMPSLSSVVPRMRCTSLRASATGGRFAVRASSAGTRDVDEIAFDVAAVGEQDAADDGRGDWERR